MNFFARSTDCDCSARMVEVMVGLAMVLAGRLVKRIDVERGVG
jgi:hypothetical protein